MAMTRKQILILLRKQELLSYRSGK